jgi:hypothetical protein
MLSLAASDRYIKRSNQTRRVDCAVRIEEGRVKTFVNWQRRTLRSRM